METVTFNHTFVFLGTVVETLNNSLSLEDCNAIDIALLWSIWDLVAEWLLFSNDAIFGAANLFLISPARPSPPPPFSHRASSSCHSNGLPMRGREQIMNDQGTQKLKDMIFYPPFFFLENTGSGKAWPLSVLNSKSSSSEGKWEQIKVLELHLSPWKRYMMHMHFSSTVCC